MGALAGVIVLVTGLARLSRVASASAPMPNGQWTRLAALISTEYGLKRFVQLLESRNSSILVTWGLVHPKVVMPAGSSKWPEDRARIVLCHELAHIRRGDWIVQMIAQTLRILYWFNPLVWVACRRLRLESECACDDTVLSSEIEGHEYAAHLLDLARVLNRPDRAWSAALTMARPSTIERRFSAMLNPTLNRYPVSRLALFATVFIGLCVTVFLSAAGSAGPARSTMASLEPAVLERIETAAIALPEAAPTVMQPAPIAPPQTQTAARPILRPELLQVTSLSRWLSPGQNEVRGQDNRFRRGSALDRALFEAAEDGELSDIEELLRAGANVNAVIDGDGTPLMGAANDGHLEAVRLLLDRGANPNIPVDGDGNALIVAAGEGHFEVVRLLLDRGADPNAAVLGDGNPLIAAASEGHADIVSLLLDRGANIDQVVPGDENALIQASGEGHLDVVRLLVNRRADVNVRVWIEPNPWLPNGEWRTALSEARREGHQDIVLFLLSAGAKD
jgi:ankyrin repeat protein